MIPKKTGKKNLKELSTHKQNMIKKTTGISISKLSVKSEGKNQLIFDGFLVLSNVSCES